MGATRPSDWHTHLLTRRPDKTDFGSAKMNIAFYEQQQYNSLKGTVNFMAPEVIKQKGSGRFADI